MVRLSDLPARSVKGFVSTGKVTPLVKLQADSAPGTTTAIETESVVVVEPEVAVAAAPAIVEIAPVADVPRTVDVKSIQWVSPRKRYYVTARYQPFLDGVKELLLDPQLNFALLFEDLYDYLQAHKPEKFVRFCVTATGAVPEQKRDLGTFVELREEGQETRIVLPSTFLKRCRKKVRGINL